MSERRGRNWWLLGFVTVACVPLILYYLFLLAWAFSSRDGYPMCDPEFQPWCRYDRAVTVRWYLSVVTAALAVLCLLVAFFLPRRFRPWWPWVVAPLVLLPAAIALIASVY